jgi:hypothetical protein
VPVVASNLAGTEITPVTVFSTASGGNVPSVSAYLSELSELAARAKVLEVNSVTDPKLPVAVDHTGLAL